MTEDIIHCPFCGHKLVCPVPVPERAACPRCGAQFDLRRLVETAVRSGATWGESPAGAPPEIPTAQIASPSGAAERTLPDSVRQAGLALIVAGVLRVVLSGMSALFLAEFVVGTLDPVHPPSIEDVSPVAALLLTLADTLAGMLIATGGVYALVQGRSVWTWLGIASTFLPTGCCCVFFVPVGVFAMLNLVSRSATQAT